MIPTLLFEAAVRSVLLALAVWIGLRMLGVRNVPAQKAAWGLVLAGALIMPLVLPMAAHWTVLPANVRVVLPADPQTLLEELQAGIQAKTSPEQKPAPVAATPGEGAPLIEDQGLPVGKPATSRSATAIKAEFSNTEAVGYSQPEPRPETTSAAPRSLAPLAVQPHATLPVSKIMLLLYVAV
ncbi:MAG: hypothetical protein ACXVIO_15280, partial [Candidatus Angelobacter sp.]